MKRLRRWLSAGLKALSLLWLTLFLLTAILYIRSYVRGDYVAWSRIAEHHLESGNGKIAYYRCVERKWHFNGPPEFFPPKYFNGGSSHSESHALPSWPRLTHKSERNWDFGHFTKPFLGISYDHLEEPGPPMVGIIMSRLIIPDWLPLILLALPIVTRLGWYFFRTHRRRRLIGRCHICGYDLRATPERCPECGTIPAKAVT